MSTHATLEAPAPSFPALSLNDRCDRCSAEALVRLVLPVGERDLDLLMCGHHARQYEAALTQQGARVTETKTVNVKPSPAAY